MIERSAEAELSGKHRTLEMISAVPDNRLAPWRGEIMLVAMKQQCPWPVATLQIWNLIKAAICRCHKVTVCIRIDTLPRQLDGQGCATIFEQTVHLKLPSSSSYCTPACFPSRTRVQSSCHTREALTYWQVCGRSFAE